jgi:hypothetical protein
MIERFFNCLPHVYSGENSHIEALNFYPNFILLDECKVSGVSVQRSRWPEKQSV